MTKPKTTKSKSTTKAAGHKSKPYKTLKTTGLTHAQKGALAQRMMIRVADLMEMDDAKLEHEALVGIDRKLMGAQLSAWLSYLPGAFGDTRLPQPSRARGRRKL
jgi:hypothetical protein